MPNHRSAIATNHLILSSTALLTLVFAFPCQAQDWMQISRTPGVLVQIDKKSFTFLSQGRLRYWERQTFDPPRSTSRGDIHQLMILREANCDEQYDEVVQMLAKPPGTEVQTPIDTNREKSRRYAAPGSTIKTVLDEACPSAPQLEPGRRF